MDTFTPRGMIKWWAVILVGSAAALLFAWLGHLAGVPLSTLLAVAAGGVALAWLVVLVTVPWNLYFAARRAVSAMAASRERGIAVQAAHEAEAARLAGRMLWFALGAHLATAVAAAVITWFSGRDVGYYAAGFFLFSTAIRPGLAYLAHVRQRITALSREARFPRDDVVALKSQVAALTAGLKQAEVEHGQLAGDLHRAERTLAGDIAHAQAAGRSRADDLERRIDQMVRGIEDTLDGLSDHQELLTGIRALARMFRPDPA